MPDDLLPRRLVAGEALRDQLVDGSWLGRKELGRHAIEHIGGKRDDNKAFFAMSNDGRSDKIPSVTTTRPGFAFDAAAGLSCDGVPLADIAASTGTPTYVYSAASIRSTWQRFDAAFAGVPHAIHYALKANSTLALLRLLRGLGQRRRRQLLGRDRGRAPRRVHPRADGLHRRRQDARRTAAAVPLGLRSINAESPGELERIDALARSLGTRARVAVRLNPDIEAGAHPHISTGRRINKFGVPIELGRALYRKMAGTAGLQPVGRPRAHRVADHRRRATPAGRRGAGGVRGRPSRGRHRARAHRPGRRPRHLVRRRGDGHDRRLRGGGAARGRARPASRSSSSPAAPWLARPGCCWRASWTSRPTSTRSRSSCSTPA